MKLGDIVFYKLRIGQREVFEFVPVRVTAIGPKRVTVNDVERPEIKRIVNPKSLLVEVPHVPA